MSSNGTTLTTLPPKSIKKFNTKNKSSKRSRKTQTNNSNNNTNSVNNVNNNSIINNKPLKVVYISNPMKFQVNADEFQTLVQGLTGRDAVEWPDEGFNNLAQDVASINGGVAHDDVAQQEPLIVFDDQVDCYDGSSPDDNFFGPLDSNDSMLISMEDLQAFIFSDN